MLENLARIIGCEPPANLGFALISAFSQVAISRRVSNHQQCAWISTDRTKHESTSAMFTEKHE